MIQTEENPTLCARCIHAAPTKSGYPGCDIGNFGIEGDVAERIRDWLKRQNDVTSWTYMGGCPSFINNGSSPQFMSASERRALHKLSRGIT